MFDFIGDIHGHADKLELLLTKLGYSPVDGAYSHPEREVVFLGDYIDRGPKVRETLQIIRNMVESNKAIALMGNHEYNAICFHYQESEGGHLRKHLIKNIVQHYETLKQFHNRQDEYEDYIDWFKTLPLFYETDTFRAVHACWYQDDIDFLKQVLINYKLSDSIIYQSVKKGTRLHNAVEDVLKGKELQLPDGVYFHDKENNKRCEIRIKWWEDVNNSNYRNVSVEPLDHLPEDQIDLSDTGYFHYYKHSEKPVFFGHYWLKGKPQIHRDNICCLDYSVAKGGHLAAYRFDGEKKLDNGKFVFV